MKKTFYTLCALLWAVPALGAPLSLDIHTPAKSKPMQFAKVYFLPDWRKDKLSFDEGADCSAYPLISCKPPMIPDASSRCPNNPSFFSRCTCPESYKTCDLPTYGSGLECDGKYQNCVEDTERACKEQNPNYTNSCPAGTEPDPNKRCSYDSSYGECCNTCADYPYTEIKDGYEASSECVDCNGVTHYQLTPKDCGDGFFACDNGPEIGAEECKSGEDILYSNCKPDTPVCPAPYIIKETYWCDGAFSCWNMPSENPCDWCDNAWRCVMP